MTAPPAVERPDADPDPDRPWAGATRITTADVEPAAPPPAAAADAAGPAYGAATITAVRVPVGPRAERRRTARRRAVRALAVLVVLLVAVGPVIAYEVRPHGAAGAAAPRAAGPAAQPPVVLLQVAGPDGTAVASAVLRAGALSTGSGSQASRAAMLLVPGAMLVHVPGSGAMPLSDALALPDPHASVDALTDLLDVRLDGSWTLTTAGLASLVDAVGGIDARVDVDLSAKDAAGAPVVLAAGPQHLDGRSAVAYVVHRGAGEAEQVALARFKDVLASVLGRLPADAGRRSELLAGIGDGSGGTLSADVVSRVAGRLRTAVAGDRAAYETLPASTIDTGGTDASYGLDAAAAPAVLKRLFGPAVGSAGRTSVLVQNGVGVPGLVGGARKRLVGPYRFLDGGNATSFGTAESVVLVQDTTAPVVAHGRAVAAALRLPATAVRVSSQPQRVADVIVILGADFTP